MSRSRLLLVALLALTAAGLAILLLLDRGGSAAVQRPDVLRDAAELNTVIDTVLARHGIPRSAVRTWRVKGKDGSPVRVERRVAVPPEFVSVNFTHDLSRAAEEFGARAVATERTKERTVTVHIRKDGIVLQSIALVTTPPPRNPPAPGGRGTRSR